MDFSAKRTHAKARIIKLATGRALLKKNTREEKSCKFTRKIMTNGELCSLLSILLRVYIYICKIGNELGRPLWSEDI
jgi:hypothetical protein